MSHKYKKMLKYDQDQISMKILFILFPLITE